MCDWIGVCVFCGCNGVKGAKGCCVKVECVKLMCEGRCMMGGCDGDVCVMGWV